MLKIEHLRRDYSSEPLEPSDVDPDPIVQFNHWMQAAIRSEVPEPNAMTLATVGPQGQPSARVVLLKEYDGQGFVFYTNYESRKGRELEANPRVALCFVWLELQRQVRIEGIGERISGQSSTEYFQSRPRGSQIGAWASPQSETIPDREVLEAKVEALTARFDGQSALPRPDHWGGYRVRPHLIEFWQGRASRLHDRIQYTLPGPGTGWVIERLAP